MKEGYWDLFDGMESTLSQLSEKISTFVGEDSELDLFETGKDIYYFIRKKIFLIHLKLMMIFLYLYVIIFLLKMINL